MKLAEHKRTDNRYCKIAVDIDGVLADVALGLSDMLSHINNRKIEVNDIKTYDLTNLGLPRSDHKQFFTRDFYSGLKPIVDSKLVNNLYEDHEITIITARSQYDGVIHDTNKWLVDNDFMFDRLIQSVDKSIPMENYGIEVIIEDYHKNCIDLSKKGIRSLLFEQPWNKSIKLNESETKYITRVNNWEDVLSYFVHKNE